MWGEPIEGLQIVVTHLEQRCDNGRRGGGGQKRGVESNAKCRVLLRPTRSS